MENSEYDGSPQLWQMPQGGIDKGEDPLEAAYRELYEETGIRTVTLLAEARDWINYDLPPQLIGIGLKGKFRGQTQRWFAFRFEGDESEIAINPPPGGHAPEFDAWEWKPMEEPARADRSVQAGRLRAGRGGIQPFPAIPEAEHRTKLCNAFEKGNRRAFQAAG